MKHPTDRIRARAFVLVVSLALLARDVWEMRKWAAEAREIERNLRAEKGRIENGLHEMYQERIDEMHAQITALRANGFTTPVEADAEPVDAEPVEADAADEG